MHGLIRTFLGMAFVVGTTAGAAAQAAPPAAPPAMVKIWNPPPYRTLAQAVIDRVWERHKDEMVGITFHAVPPGIDRYAMIAGTYEGRVGKASAEDDIMVAEDGFVIMDPRYRKSDPEPKYLVIIPLRDQSKTNIGAIVFGFKHPPGSDRSGPEHVAVATYLRDQLQREIPNAAALYDRAP